MKSEKGKKVASATNDSVADEARNLLLGKKVASAKNDSVADEGRNLLLGKKVASATNDSVADKAQNLLLGKVASATNDSVADEGRNLLLGKKVASATNDSVADKARNLLLGKVASAKNDSVADEARNLLLGKKVASAKNDFVVDEGRNLLLGKKVASATNDSVADEGRNLLLGKKVVSAKNDSVADEGRNLLLGKKVASATNDSVADEGRNLLLGKKVAAATNESVADNYSGAAAADCDEPWNRLMEKHLRSLAVTLHKKELVDHLVNLGITFPQAAEEIKDAARLQLADRRLIVYGLNKEITSETLCKAFSSFGEIAEGNVITDSSTGNSRRFGFITFKDINSVHKALEKRNIWIDGCRAFYHTSCEGFEGATATADVELRRLYVKDLSADITNEMFLGFFAKYGEIEEGSLIYDDETSISRGYGFVTFKTFEAAMNAVNDPDKKLGRNRIFVRHAYRFRHKNV